jgi:hypothetical protein
MRGLEGKSTADSAQGAPHAPNGTIKVMTCLREWIGRRIVISVQNLI